jgi:hypothetical protein
MGLMGVPETNTQRGEFKLATEEKKTGGLMRASS